MKPDKLNPSGGIAAQLAQRVYVFPVQPWLSRPRADYLSPDDEFGQALRDSYIKATTGGVYKTFCQEANEAGADAVFLTFDKGNDPDPERAACLAESLVERLSAALSQKTDRGMRPLPRTLPGARAGLLSDQAVRPFIKHTLAAFAGAALWEPEEWTPPLDQPLWYWHRDDLSRLLSGAASLGNKCLRNLFQLYYSDALGIESLLSWGGLRRLLEQGLEESKRARDLASRLAEATPEERAKAAEQLDGILLFSLRSEFDLAMKQSYRDEVFGTGRMSVNRFNAWLKREAQSQATSNPTDARKQFVANAIQHYVKEKDWELFLVDGDTLIPCTVAIGKYIGGRRYQVREPGGERSSLVAPVRLPLLQATP